MFTYMQEAILDCLLQFHFHLVMVWYYCMDTCMHEISKIGGFVTIECMSIEGMTF